MGCSPSKGKLFSKPEGSGPPKALLAEVPQEGIHSFPIEEKRIGLKTDEKVNELPAEEQPVKEDAWSQLSSKTPPDQGPDDIEETQVTVPQDAVDEVDQSAKNKKTKKRQKNKGKRRSSEKQKLSFFRAKLDFPPHMVRAHQAAYAYLNPNISKYETLLGLLDQATQTQLSLQPMMAALVLRFEEINQALEEMAEEGGLMMKEHGDYMALPSGMIGPGVIQRKTTMATARPPDPPPDLLQQLLQHSVVKMRLVGKSVQELGNTTLEEAVDYFASVSKVLVEKLQAKRAVEQRLVQVLARVESAAMRKSNPEDSALHSEDSGIGGESESLPGSERHRHRGSAGSGSCGSGINIRGTFDVLPNNSANFVGHNEEGEEEEDDNDEEYEDLDDDRPERTRSNSSPPDPSQSFLYLHANYLKDLQTSIKRPLTAIKPEQSSSSCGTIKLELQSSKKDLDQRMQKMTEIQGHKDRAGPPYNLHRPGLRRHTLSGSPCTQKGTTRETQLPSSLPILLPHPPKHNSVRRLINTFSQGVDGRPGQSLANIPPHIRRPGKSGIAVLSDTMNGTDCTSIINGNNNNNSWPDSRDDLDEDTLPPPPPEVLMDDSFIQGNEGRLKEGSAPCLPLIIQNTRISQRLKASVQNVEVLPSRASVQQRSTSILPVRPVRQDAVLGAQDADQQPETEANTLYQQTRKIIHLSNAANSLEKQDIVGLSSRGSSSLQDRMDQRCDTNEVYEDELSTCYFPVTTPPVSRVRLPPCCPSVCHRFPNPPVLKHQTTSQPSSRPGSPRTVTRSTDNNVEVIIPSVSFSAARSVFCFNEPQNSQTSRGRLLVRRGDNSTRRTQSEQRPCMTSNSEFSKDGIPTSSQAQGTGSANTDYR